MASEIPTNLQKILTFHFTDFIAIKLQQCCPLIYLYNVENELKRLILI